MSEAKITEMCYNIKKIVMKRFKDSTNSTIVYDDYLERLAWSIAEDIEGYITGNPRSLMTFVNATLPNNTTQEQSVKIHVNIDETRLAQRIADEIGRRLRNNVRSVL